MRSASQARLAALRGEDAGFTMIEVVVSFVLLAIIAASAGVAVAGGIKSANTSQDRVTATNLAQQQIEQIRAAQYAPAGTTTASVGNKAFTVTRAITTPTPSGAVTASCYPGGVQQVTVIVTPRGSSRSVRMDTVLAC